MMIFQLLSIKVNTSLLTQSLYFFHITIFRLPFVSFIASLDSISLPNTIYEALSHFGWHCAMVDEMQALDDNSA